jgi:nucleotide-binding universal stress UspA family protein
MFKNILVPLDGSKLAESGLKAAVTFAKRVGAPITLLHIIEKDAPQEIHHSDHHITGKEEAVSYLDGIVKQESKNGIIFSTHVHTTEVKDVAASIIHHSTEEFDPDLIVMCAHGQSGLRDIVFGNIAQQVLAGGQTPILLIQPGATKTEDFFVKRIFVPLDSESKHDESLKYATGLAKSFDAELYLFTVVPTYSTLTGRDAVVSNMMPVTAAAYLDILEENAKEHLQEHLDDLIKEGYAAKAEIARGDPIELISSTAIGVDAGLILLSTHKKAGFGAFWARSVAPNVVKKSRIPILLIPLNE